MSDDLGEADDFDLDGEDLLPPDPPKEERRYSRAGAKKGDQKKRNEKTKWWRAHYKGKDADGETKCTLKECLRAVRVTEGYMGRAAKILGVTTNTLKQYCLRWPELAELVQEYDRRRFEEVIEAGYDLATGKDGEKNDRMIRFILDRKKLAEEYGFEKKYKDDKPPIQINIQQQTAILLTDERKQELLNKVKRNRMVEHERKQMDEGLLELKKQEEEKNPPLTPE